MSCRWDFHSEKLFCSCLANETDVPAFREIVFIEITPGDERDSPGLKIILAQRRDLARLARFSIGGTSRSARA